MPQVPSPSKTGSYQVTYRQVPGSWQRRARPDMHPDCFRVPEPGPGEVIYVTKGEFIAWGGTAFIEQLPSGNVVKTPTPNPYSRLEEEDHRKNMRVEAQIYTKLHKRFGDHPCIPRLIEWQPETCCLTMEFMENGALRDYLRRNADSVTLIRRLQWGQQAAEALHLLHSVDVIHCDISPRNFLLDHNLDLKISDFGGASLCGSEPSAIPEPRFLRPNFDSTPVIEDDLFGLGSLLYFIMTGHYPFEEKSEDDVERLYKAHQFPDTTQVFCGPIIQGCWEQQVQTAQAVSDYLKETHSVHISSGLTNPL
ncbi:hypothetical protein PRK78_005468 [Emydomyces testavorans]|uniref:EKC/KEOPS complex subunit BUD32 n=1 Tax=Emydomyces testavorans TaxID=2070801 RepID=A0AAF0DJM9_9EURO|nr:hypothetical protein PRK78_005468 [Emydomyces testavorans]